MNHLFYLCLVFVMLSHLFIAALCSPEGKGLTSWLLFVMLIVFLLLSHLVSWDRCSTCLYRFLILAVFLTYEECHLNYMKLFPIWTSNSGGDVVCNISYLELWLPSSLAEWNHLGIFRSLRITAAEVWVILWVHRYKSFNIFSHF